MYKTGRINKKSMIIKILLVFFIAAAVLSSGCTQPSGSTPSSDIVGKWSLKSDMSEGAVAVEFFADKTVVLGDPSFFEFTGTYGFTDSNHLTITYEETKDLVGDQKFVVVSRSHKQMVLQDVNGNLWTYTRMET